MNIVAVIVTYNRKYLLKECLNAILNQKFKVSKIILVDNASSDGTHEKLINEGFLSLNIIDYIFLKKNIGGAGGFNVGINAALNYNPSWVWVMDDDTIPNYDCLYEMINSLNIIDDKISFLASSVFGTNDEPMNVPSISNKKSINGYKDWYKYLRNGIVKINNATFVSILVNTNAIKLYGLPCKEFFIWGDDIEYTQRLVKKYGNAYMIGNSIVIHKRENAKALSIFYETNINRIKLFHYFVRNNIIIDYFFKSKLSFFKDCIIWNMICIKLFFSKDGLKMKKIFSIHKGLFNYLIHGKKIKSELKKIYSR